MKTKTKKKQQCTGYLRTFSASVLHAFWSFARFLSYAPWRKEGRNTFQRCIIFYQETLSRKLHQATLRGHFLTHEAFWLAPISRRTMMWHPSLIRAAPSSCQTLTEPLRPIHAHKKGQKKKGPRLKLFEWIFHVQQKTRNVKWWPWTVSRVKPEEGKHGGQHEFYSTRQLLYIYIFIYKMSGQLVSQANGRNKLCTGVDDSSSVGGNVRRGRLKRFNNYVPPNSCEYSQVVSCAVWYLFSTILRFIYQVASVLNSCSRWRELPISPI